MPDARDPRNYPFAVFGGVQFQLARTPKELGIETEWNFTEHERLAGQPLLQSVGDPLRKINLSFQFHHLFCEPQTEYLELKAIAIQKNPTPLTVGDWFLGFFVINRLNYDLILADSVGTPLAIEVEMALTEWIGRVEAEPAPVRLFPRRLRRGRSALN